MNQTVLQLDTSGNYFFDYDGSGNVNATDQLISGSDLAERDYSQQRDL